MKFILKSLLLIGSAAALVGMYIILSAAAPEMHRDYLRYKVGSKVVRILRMSDLSGGTGFHIKAKSGKVFILTNKHVCALANKKEEVNIQYQYEGITLNAIRKVVKRHSTHDLCLIEPIGDDGLSMRSDDLYTGQSTYVYGHPGLRPLTLSQGEFIASGDVTMEQINILKKDCPGTFTEIPKNPITDLLNLKTHCRYKLSAYRITNLIYSGNSGSPMVDFWGNIVGVVFAVNPKAPTDGFAIPYPVVKDFIENN